MFDRAAERVSPELRKGPRGGGRAKVDIIRHVNVAEINEFAPKVGVKVSDDTAEDLAALHAYRDAFAAALHGNHSAVSKLERADDMSLSRLRNAVEALGGELEVGVRIDGVLFPLQLLDRESA